MSINFKNSLTELCAECEKKFRVYLKSGGAVPKACTVCQEKLKTKMFASRYPDRT